MMDKPLAIKMQPEKIKDVLGQEHLLGDNKVLSNLVKNKKLFSLILYGPPGVGKTSIANALVNDLDIRARFLNAVVNNKEDIMTVVREAKFYDGIVLVMDEIHRLNKDKQDILLPELESGAVTLIGLTTSNPYHSINPAIRSRVQIFELKQLTDKDILKGLKRAVKHPNLDEIQVSDKELEYIVNYSSGDLRASYNLLEIAYYTASDKKITIEHLREISNKPVQIADKDGDGHYDLLSAFQKSIRGSDVDASLHYLARLLEFGDFDSIYRRMTVIAYEDIGLANPGIGPKIRACIESCELVGMPEARIPLAVMIIEMALSPKSNTAYNALDKAITDVQTGRSDPIPETIKNSSKIYKYPHDYPGNFVKQQYLPNNLENKKYYIPKDSGYEINIKKVYEAINKQKKETK